MVALDQSLFEPEPLAEPLWCTVISVDDHVVEPPEMFRDRVPAAVADSAPRIVELEAGQQVWEFDGRVFSQTGLNAVAGRRRDQIHMEPARFDQMRPGCYDPAARILDMDVNGVWASLNFPSQITGFCGKNFSLCSSPDVGLAVTRAWNDWIYEEWYAPHPERIIPLGITWLSDPRLGAKEIVRNAERGFRSVTLPERPHNIGLPSLFTDYWDPILRACDETETVISLHVGSTGTHAEPDGAPKPHLSATLFGQLSLLACAEWVWSGIPVRYPNIKIAMSEGGIGWVPMLFDRLENIYERAGYTMPAWPLTPAEVLARNFWFCTIDDPSTIRLRDRVGVDRIMIEVDYPHADSTWPHTQSVMRREWSDIPHNELHLMTHANAATLFRHPLPSVCRDGVEPVQRSC